jgi:hypothetical protein
VADNTDCDDSETGAEVNPGATEICTDGEDNDCDGDIDGADSVCSIIFDITGEGSSDGQYPGSMTGLAGTATLNTGNGTLTYDYSDANVFIMAAYNFVTSEKGKMTGIWTEGTRTLSEISGLGTMEECENIGSSDACNFFLLFWEATIFPVPSLLADGVVGKSIHFPLDGDITFDVEYKSLQGETTSIHITLVATEVP